MTKAIIIFLLLFSIMGQSLALGEDDHCTIIGFEGGKDSTFNYNINFNFGIEQWEEGRLTTGRYQQWMLDCYLYNKQSDTSCNLERVVIDKWAGELIGGAMVTTHKHYSSDGTLRLNAVDWQKGKLDFTIIFTDKDTAEVMLRFKTKNTMLCLDSFKSFGIAKGWFSDSMVAVEYRIPKYTYILSVPMAMRGLRSMDDKKWDEMFATLSREDQVAWQKFKAGSEKQCNLYDNKSWEQIIRKVIPDYEKRILKTDEAEPFTPEEEKKVQALWADELLAKCLSKFGISSDGQKKITNFIKQPRLSKR